MKKIILLLISAITILAQVENVPLEHSVYTFLKEMEIKKIIYGIDEDVPNLSRIKVKQFLEKIESQKNQLSSTEKALLKKHQIEFYPELEKENRYLIFGEKNILNSPLGLFSDRLKYFYAAEDEESNLFVEMIGHFNYGGRFQPSINNSELYDIGFRLRGTLFKNLGYNLSVVKGAISGNRDFAAVVDPRLNYNFKYLEDIEPIGNYDFTAGYLQYRYQHNENAVLTFQIGRENITLGYGYNSKLVLSGDHTNLDFIKFNVQYGIIDFTSIHASTVGRFSLNKEDLYTKYFAIKRLKFGFENLFDFGLGEVIVYSGRGIDIAYLNPFIFYKFAEMSLQDRDNGLFFFDVQSNFLKNFEIQASFFMDENFIGKLGELDRFNNKTAYQVGLKWYEAFTLPDLTLMTEYTKIRPYVYTHDNYKNTYSAFSTGVGHEIGPNSDQIFFKAAYNLNAWVRPEISYSFTRRGENIVDENGNLIKNVGGDIFQPYRYNVDPETAPFLDGNRINRSETKFLVRVEPWRDIIFDLSYYYIFTDFIDENRDETLSYIQAYMTLQF